MNNPFDEDIELFKSLLKDAKEPPKTKIDKELIETEEEEIHSKFSADRPSVDSSDETPDEITEEINDLSSTEGEWVTCKPEDLHKTMAELGYEIEDKSNDNPLIAEVGLSPTQYQSAVRMSEELATVDERKEVQKTFRSLYNDLNKKYGLSLNMDADSFSELMRGISDPKMKEAMNLYTSEAFGRFRTLLYNKYLQAIALMSEQILDPSYILSEEVDYESKLSLMERLFKFMASIEQIYTTVNIENSDIKLAHLSDQNGSSVDLNDPGTRDLLAKLLNQK